MRFVHIYLDKDCNVITDLKDRTDDRARLYLHYLCRGHGVILVDCDHRPTAGEYADCWVPVDTPSNFIPWAKLPESIRDALNRS